MTTLPARSRASMKTHFEGCSNSDLCDALKRGLCDRDILLYGPDLVNLIIEVVQERVLSGQNRAAMPSGLLA